MGVVRITPLTNAAAGGLASVRVTITRPDGRAARLGRLGSGRGACALAHVQEVLVRLRRRALSGGVMSVLYVADDQLPGGVAR